MILLSAERFADGLVQTGEEFGISPFFLVQWVAPLASEAPELLVAGLYAWHLNTTNGLGTLVSSKVNQWTLLVGTLPLVFAVASGTATGLPVGPAQREELLLTAAQSLFAVALLVNLYLSAREAAALVGLFLLQFALAALVPGATELVALSVTYLLLAAVLLVRARNLLGPTVRDACAPPTSSSPTSPSRCHARVATAPGAGTSARLRIGPMPYCGRCGWVADCTGPAWVGSAGRVGAGGQRGGVVRRRRPSWGDGRPAGHHGHGHRWGGDRPRHRLQLPPARPLA